MRLILLVGLVYSLVAHAIPDEEKQRVCRDLSRKVLLTLQKRAYERCMEFAENECDRIERTYRENCAENSHADNAIKYDIDRGTASSCQAALMKRETHRTLCDGLRHECAENHLKLGQSSVEVRCPLFRDDDDKRICNLVDAAAVRIIAAEKADRETCAKFAPKPPPPAAVSTATSAPRTTPNKR